MTGTLEISSPNMSEAKQTAAKASGVLAEVELIMGKYSLVK